MSHASPLVPGFEQNTTCRMSLKDILENDPEAYYDKSELLKPLRIMYESLISTHDTLIANGRLLDVIRQVLPVFLYNPPPPSPTLP